MLYDVGVFCITLAIIIGFSTIIFRLPKTRSLTLIITLLVISTILVGIGLSDLSAIDTGSAHE